MAIKNPSRDVIRAVKGGIAWFAANRIDGFRYTKSSNKPSLSTDPSARPLWARFYELGTNRPIFCDRDGVVKYDIDEIGSERRGGYTWYGSWARALPTCMPNGLTVKSLHVDGGCLSGTVADFGNNVF